MPALSIENQCELGQQQLMRMEYLEAEATLAAAEQEALVARDWNALSRLYMPLQEARRQRRQKCGEGIVCLDLLAEGPDDRLDPRHVIEHYPHGQLLVAGWGSIEPAIKVRELAMRHGLYVETYLAAGFAVEAGRLIVIVPLEDAPLPNAQARSMERLLPHLPPGSLVLSEAELPRGPHKGSYQTFARTMALWERLHAPFLAEADAQSDASQRIEGYRKTIRVDYACELAHQKLSAVARELGRRAMRNAER